MGGEAALPCAFSSFVDTPTYCRPPFGAAGRAAFFYGGTDTYPPVTPHLPSQTTLR